MEKIGKMPRAINSTDCEVTKNKRTSFVRLFSSLIPVVCFFLLITCNNKSEQAIKPSNSGSPTISGQVTINSAIKASNGAWLGTPYPTLTYQWFRGMADGIPTSIEGETSPTYTIKDSDMNQLLFVTVYAKNDAGTAQATSRAVGPVFVGPENTAIPVISADSQGFTVGAVLTVSDGVWGPAIDLPIVTGRKWKRDGVDIPGATSQNYTLVQDDAGKTITAVVTASNTAGSAQATSLPTVQITMAPVNVQVPTISGTMSVGSKIVADPGTWKGYPDPIFSYEWFRSGVATAIATGIEYTLSMADVGTAIYVKVTATNTLGAAIANSANTTALSGSDPVNTAVPIISGVTKVLQRLTANVGTWTAPLPTFTYQWKQNGVDISGATSATYDLVSANIGTTISVAVTAIISQGGWVSNPITATSASTAIIAGIDAANTSLPSITGTTTVNQTLTANVGTWTGTPAPTYSYQWKRAGTDIAGATSSAYILQEIDIGSQLSVVITANNQQGGWVGTPVSVISANTAVIAGIAPVNITLPGIVGTTTFGQTLSANSGTWTGTPAPTAFSYQWQRGTTTIAGATSSTYTLAEADIGSTLRVLVTATTSQNAWSSGQISVASANSAVIVGIPPVNTGIPLITGTTTVGQTLSASTGNWNAGTPAPISFSYQWKRGTTNIGTNSSTYLLVAADVGFAINVTVSATNSQGMWTSTSVSSTSANTASIAGLAINNVILPEITGTPKVGSLLTSNQGTWTGTPAPTAFSYQWKTNGVNVGSNSSTYLIGTNDLGKTISVIVTASVTQGNWTSSNTATAANTTTIFMEVAPENTSAPTITGTLRVGFTLTGSPGTWTGTPAPTFEYRWARNGFTMQDYSTTSTYVIQSSDWGGTMQLFVRATNSAGSTTQWSVLTANITN